MNWLKQNWFKLGILSILLLAIGGLAYYFLFLIPTHTNNVGLQQNCAVVAGQYFANKGYEDGAGTTFTYTNHFNSNLQKCFIQISSYVANGDSLFIDLFDAVEGKHYAVYFGHSVCDPTVLAIENNSKKCAFDSGEIWLDGDDTRRPADYHIGFQGISVGPGVGDATTLKQFMDHVKSFMND